MFYFVPTPIGNIDDITIRALKLFEKVEILFCEDTRVAKSLLQLLTDRFSIKTNIKKFISLHEHNQKKILANIDLSIFDNDLIYLSDAGMPSISDPGSYIINFLIKNKIQYDVIPGASASILSYVASGFDSGKFMFYGFLDKRRVKKIQELENICSLGLDTILYESPLRILDTLECINELNKCQELFLLKEATKKFQKYFRGNVNELLNILKKENLKGEWCIVIKNSLKRSKKSYIDKKDILPLNISKKEKAKLLSKIDGKSVKYHYDNLIRNSY